MTAMKRYPRTFLQLITFGHILFALPLLVASVYVFITLETLNNRYRSAIEHVSLSSRLSGELAEDLLHMERSLRRHAILKDQDSLDDYAQVRKEWRTNIEKFAQLPPLPEDIVGELQAQIADENSGYAALIEQGKLEPLKGTIDALKIRSQKTLDQADEILHQEQEQFLAESETLRTRLAIAAAIAVVVAACCLWTIRTLLSRLIGRFEKALIRLGKGELNQPIELDGPGDLRWLGRWLEWLRRRLLSLEEGRAQVLRHVSHELKTPLAAMHEGASLLAEEVPGPLTSEQGRIVGILQSNSRRLQDLIEGLLRLQHAGHAAERIGYETLQFDQLIEEVLETSRLLAGERKIRFECSLEKLQIVAGHEALTTIIHNLVSNAIKFSPEGGSIRISLSHDPKQALLDVQDEGPGVAPQDANQIFEPFFRSPASRHLAGVGLGLAIAREFVIAHRGELLLLPSDTGAHFRVVLPLHATYLRTQDHG